MILVPLVMRLPEILTVEGNIISVGLGAWSALRLPCWPQHGTSLLLAHQQPENDIVVERRL